MLKLIVKLVFGLAVAGAVYVRLAPDDVARWHTPIAAAHSDETRTSAVIVMEAEEGSFARFDAAMRALPRTVVLAGTLKEGRITYVTRSKTIGFPDYTTVEYAHGMLKVFGRSRYGASDLGVNRDRLQGVLRALEL